VLGPLPVYPIDRVCSHRRCRRRGLARLVTIMQCKEDPLIRSGVTFCAKSTLATVGLRRVWVHWPSGAKRSLEGIIDGAHTLRGNTFHLNRMGYKAIGTIAACTLHGGPSGSRSAAPHVGFALVNLCATTSRASRIIPTCAGLPSRGCFRLRSNLMWCTGFRDSSCFETSCAAPRFRGSIINSARLQCFNDQLSISSAPH
jgi:hypothetical protein